MHSLRQMRDSGFDWFSHNPEWMAVKSFDWWDKTQGSKFLYFAFTLPHMPLSLNALQKPVENIPVREDTRKNEFYL